MSLISEEQFAALQRRVISLENRLGEVNYEVKGVVRSELASNSTIVSQSEMQFGLYTGLVVETVDIWKQNRVRFYCPIYHDPKRPIKELPWAYPVSAMGGFDDCGLNWVPPAGSTVCILFECGHRSSPYYIGTTWHRDRGPNTQAHNWGINIDEYYRVWQKSRDGYLVGPNDGSQCLPPWNTESYNGFDISSIVDFSENPEAQKRITIPNIYGFKTPEKHMIKMVDGDPNCNNKWKRFELMSSNGNWIMMKDDHLHYGGQWSHPNCGVEDGDVSCIEGIDEGDASEDITRFQGLSPSSGSSGDTNVNITPGTKKEEVDCEGKQSNKKIIGGHPSTGHPQSKYYKAQKGANPYFKHENECRPYKGPQTPQNNRCDLPQSGIQVMSISGHTAVFDDSVEEPSGELGHKRGRQAFDFGCNDVYLGRMYFKSATGHMIEMSDVESDSKLRGENNYIRLLTATGNKIELNDHTVSQKDCPGCPPNIAGPKRGIFMKTTADNTFEMCDDTNEQCGECRKEGGTPAPKAKKAYIKIRTGYGLEFTMKDDNSQQETSQQNIQLFCPQKDNSDRGPHISRYQESKEGPGLVFLRVGGNYVISTYDNAIEVVGDEEKNPADKIEIISRKKLVYSKDVYINVTDSFHLFFAKKQIILLAGEDCEGDDGSGPCFAPVVVYDMSSGCLRLSDRVYATTSSKATQASIFMLSPFIKPSEQ